MKAKINLLLLIQALYLFELVSSSYYSQDLYYQPTRQHDYYEYEEVDDYDADTGPQRRRASHATHNHGSHREDCSDKMHKCACNKCDNPHYCCESFCASCSYMAGQSNLVFVPFPYPLMMSGTLQNTTKPPTTTESTTASTTLSTTARPTLSVEDGIQEILGISSGKSPVKLKGESSRYMLTSLRRTKSTWMPRYGIVPIPDKLAERLMSQLREVKDFNYRPDRV